MELDDLILVWKKQDKNINQGLHNETLRHLLKERSRGILSKIRNILTGELVAIAVVFILFNVIFILANLPYTLIRWACFVLFNIILLWYIYYYKKAVSSIFKLKYNHDLKTNMERIVKSLSRFRNGYKLLNLPIIFLCIVVFAAAQNIIILVPWMVLEVLIWRSVLLPKLMVRFEGYKADLEYSLKDLQELQD